MASDINDNMFLAPHRLLSDTPLTRHFNCEDGVEHQQLGAKSSSASQKSRICKPWYGGAVVRAVVGAIWRGGR